MNQHLLIKNIKLLVSEGILDKRLLEFDLKKLAESLELDRDFKFKYLGLQILHDRYFHHIEGRRLESPQSFWMRVSMGLGSASDIKASLPPNFDTLSHMTLHILFICSKDNSSSSL